MNNYGYTIVQHSGSGYAGDPQFYRGLEERAVSTKRELETIEKVGGLLFDTYQQASKFAQKEMYRNVSGFALTPQAPGTFSHTEVDGLRIYIPEREHA